MNVELHIERLVLHDADLAPAGRAALARALGRELTLLIQDGGVAPSLLSGAGLPRMTATLAAPAAGNASGAGSALGRNIARSVYSCLGPQVIRR
jgi:hypothetical protein